MALHVNKQTYPNCSIKKPSHFAIIWNLIFMNINYFKEENKSDDTLWTSRLHTFRKKKVSLIFKQETVIIMLSMTRLIFL